MQARAAVSTGDGDFSIVDIEVQSPGSGEVLVELQASGVCHTDHDSLSWEQTHVIGHEGAGVVLECGAGVSSVAPGDHVLLNWAIPCGRCQQCARGNQHLCDYQSPVTRITKHGGHAAAERSTYQGQPIERSFNLGTLSTHTVVLEAAVVKIAKDIPFSSACIVGCGVMTGYGSVINAAKVEAGSTVTVLGAGGVGLNAIQAARVAGAREIVAVDINAQRLEFARQFGATQIYQADPSDKGLRQAAAEIRQQFDGFGTDYAFECTAVPALGDAPLAFIRNAGTAVAVSGIEEVIAFDAELFEWDKIYINTLYGKCKPSIDFPRIFDLYKKKQLLLDELVTQTYSLDNLESAFADMLAGRNAKGVILLGDSR